MGGEPKSVASALNVMSIMLWDNLQAALVEGETSFRKYYDSLVDRLNDVIKIKHSHFLMEKKFATIT